MKRKLTNMLIKNIIINWHTNFESFQPATNYFQYLLFKCH